MFDLISSEKKQNFLLRRLYPYRLAPVFNQNAPLNKKQLFEKQLESTRERIQLVRQPRVEIKTSSMCSQVQLIPKLFTQ